MQLASWFLARPCRASVVGAGVLASSMAGAAEPAIPCVSLDAPPAHTVTRILDGETLALADGSELRLIGALAPRAIDVDAEPDAWPMETGATEALRRLARGKSIALGSVGARTDRYGRRQAHAFLVERHGRRRWVQRYLVAHGLARVYALAGDLKCSEELLAAERTARAARRGLWAVATYRIRQADRPAELLRHRATFQIVEGRIASVGMRRTTIYLNFARNWRRGFAASLRRRDRALLGAYAARPWDLEGRRVRVRGWIAQQRSGAPIVDLSAGGLIEVLTELPDPSSTPARANQADPAQRGASGNAAAPLEKQQRRARQQHGNAHQ